MTAANICSREIVFAFILWCTPTWWYTTDIRLPCPTHAINDISEIASQQNADYFKEYLAMKATKIYEKFRSSGLKPEGSWDKFLQCTLTSRQRDRCVKPNASNIICRWRISQADEETENSPCSTIEVAYASAPSDLLVDVLSGIWVHKQKRNFLWFLKYLVVCICLATHHVHKRHSPATTLSVWSH